MLEIIIAVAISVVLTAVVTTFVVKIGRAHV